MITYTKRKGRLGNRLFQLASLMGLAERYGHELRLPAGDTWDLLKYFDVDIPTLHGRANRFVVEKNFHYDPGFFEQELSDKSRIIDINGWMQTEKYFGSQKLRFKQDYKERIWQKYGFVKKTIAISVRRGDFVGNENYYQLPIEYYIGALLENFPDWKDYDLVFFSDDPAYCKIHFGCLENAHFPELSPIDQLCLGSQCTHYIISNSTFSWWMAYLNETDKRVIRPLRNFDGPLAENHDESDYWPTSQEWQIFNHEGYKIDLTDTTFIIPVSYDHPDRKQNLDLSVCLLQRVFDTNVIIMEHGGEKFRYQSQWCRYETFKGKHFHRTRMLNEMTVMSETPIVVNWDCDNVIAPMQLLQGIEKVREGASIVYPFDGQSARVPRIWFKTIEKGLDAGLLTDKYKGLGEFNSVGHAVICDREAFIEGGMENEHFISFGPEDVERFERFTRLGYRVEKVKGPVFHLDHFKGTNSSAKNPHFGHNWKELEKERGMSDEELRQYVSTWEWVKQFINQIKKTA